MTIYLNPVYGRNFPDPFVFRYCGEYWAYCTGTWRDERCFGVLHSRDLVHWHELGGAMEPLPDMGPYYWAPEVVYHNGQFFLYYSVGNEELMQMRVAVADQPAGPFIDSGRRLTHEPFAIDGHVFVDDDGTRYLFYATDFLEHTHIGTGTVRDRMLDPLTLAGDPQPVTRPRYDWHVYDPQRAEKGGVRWHTIEGSFVLKRKGRYYQMFSGGNWQNTTYGVSYAITEQIRSPEEWRQAADGEQVLPILRTLPGLVIGPGHNSVVRGPDNRQLYCVYHRWDQDIGARVMAIDPLDWAGERMLALGPSTTPQPAPSSPTWADYFDGQHPALSSQWQTSGGNWTVREGAAIQDAHTPATAIHHYAAESFVAEISLRALEQPAPDALIGVALHPRTSTDSAPREAILVCEMWPGRREIVVRSSAGQAATALPLPADFNPQVYHLLRIDVSHAWVRIDLDERPLWCGPIAPQPLHVALQTSGIAGAFAGFALTTGWEDTFAERTTLDTLGWYVQGTATAWQLRDQQLICTAEHTTTSATKRASYTNYLLVVSARLYETSEASGGYGFYPAIAPDHTGPLVTIQPASDGWKLHCQTATDAHTFALPHGFDPYHYQQFRFRKQDERLEIHWEMYDIGTITLPSAPTSVGLHVSHAQAAFDLVRIVVDE